MTLIFSLVISLMVDSWVIGFGFSFGLLLLIGILFLPVRLIVMAICKLPTGKLLAARFGLGNIKHQGSRATASVLSIGIGLAAILLITLLQSNVIGSLEDILNDSRSYNIMILGPTGDSYHSVIEHLNQQNYVDHFTTVLSMNGRITAINDVHVNDLNLLQNHDQIGIRTSITGIDPQDEYLQTPISQGEWFSPEFNKGELIVHTDFAHQLGLAVGDTVAFDVAGQSIELRVIGISKDEDSGIRIGIASQLMMARAAVEEIGAFSPERSMIMIRTKDGYTGSESTSDLRSNFPELGMILDLGQLFEILYTVFNTSTLFMQFIGLFSVFAGGIILAGMIILSKYQRRKDIAIIRCLGGNNRTVLGANFFEYAVIGIISGGLGIIASNIIVYGIVRFGINSQFVFEPLLNAGFLVLATLFTSIIGMISIADALGEKPLNVLKYE